MVLPYTGGIPAIDEYYKSQNIDPLDLLHTDSREYIVTLHNYEDLDDFYKDMELNSNLEPIPDRECECTEKRPKSKSTHYNLTGKEAVTLRNDKRVKIVEETPKRLEEEYGIKVVPTWSQTGNWDKAPDNIGDLQWGIARSIAGYNFNNWGTDVIDEVSATFKTTSSGKNVDVVIWDGGGIPSDHPDFAVNSDGTGGSRVKEINWFQYSDALGYTTEATYEYSPSFISSHATSVASIAAGNRFGWARDANIYTISFTPATVSGQPTSWFLWALDYIKYWHQHKEINPETGRRNPTIINASFVTRIDFGDSGIYQLRIWPRHGAAGEEGVPNIIGARTKDVSTSLTGRGQGVGGWDTWYQSYVPNEGLKSTLSTHWPTVYSNIQTSDVPLPFGDEPYLWDNGIGRLPQYNETMGSMVEDIVTEGCGSFSSLLFVGGAGNEYYASDMVPDDGIQTFDFASTDQGSHFNHDCILVTEPTSPEIYSTNTGNLTIYHVARGCTPAASPSAISVGALDTLTSQYKTNFSNFATGVDVWASGAGLICANSNTDVGPDPRDPNYGITIFGGTSAASPQVAGVLACELELNPMMNVSQAKRYLKMNCTASLENGSGTNSGNFQDSGSDITEPSEKYGGKSRVGAKRVIKTEVKRNYGQAPAGAVSTPFTSPIYAFGYSYPHENFGIRQYENENPDSLVSPTWRAPQIFDNKTRGIAYPRSSRSFNRGNFNCQEMDYSNNNRIIYDIFYSGAYEGKVAWGLYLGGVNKVDSGIIDPPSAIPQSILNDLYATKYPYYHEIIDYLNLLSATYHPNSGATISPEDGGNIANSDNYSITELVEVQDLGNAIRYNCKVQKCPVQCSDYRFGVDTMKYGLGANLSWSTGVSYIRALESNTTYFDWQWILKWDNEIVYASPISGTDNWPSGKDVTGGLIYDNTSVDGYKYYNDTNSRLNNTYTVSDTVINTWRIYDVKRCR